MQRQVLDAIANNTLVLLYFHSMIDVPNAVYTLPDQFEQMMRWLALEGVETLQTTDALEKYGYL
jgi:hypothetical protein